MSDACGAGWQGRQLCHASFLPLLPLVTQCVAWPAGHDGNLWTISLRRGSEWMWLHHVTVTRGSLLVSALNCLNTSVSHRVAVRVEETRLIHLSPPIQLHCLRLPSLKSKSRKRFIKPIFNYLLTKVTVNCSRWAENIWHPVTFINVSMSWKRTILLNFFFSLNYRRKWGRGCRNELIKTLSTKFAGKNYIFFLGQRKPATSFL